MPLSRAARTMTGLTVLLVPTIMYGGIFLLGVLTHGAAGLHTSATPNDTQWALMRAGHAHAGILIVLSLVIQILLDSAVLADALKWLARLAAPLAAICVSGGFFGLANSSDFRWLLYTGGGLLILTLLLTGIGLLRRLPA